MVHDPTELLGDDGVLRDCPTLVLGSLCRRLPITHQVWVCEPWKHYRPPGDYQRCALPDELPDQQWSQIIIIAERHRAVSYDALLVAISHLSSQGCLLVVGGNDTGIRTTIKHFAQHLKQASSCEVSGSGDSGSGDSGSGDCGASEFVEGRV